MPTRKITAVTASAALVQLIAWIVLVAGGPEMDGPTQGAATTVVAAIVGYLVPDAPDYAPKRAK